MLFFPQNILAELQQHYEDEKETLLAKVCDGGSRSKKENLRKLELARLRQQQRIVEGEEGFESAAVLLNLTEQQDLAAKEGYSRTPLYYPPPSVNINKTTKEFGPV